MAEIRRIRQGNDFFLLWQIKENGVPVDLQSLSETIKLKFQVERKTSEYALFEVLADGVLKIEIKSEHFVRLGTYRFIVEYAYSDTSMSDSDRKRTTDYVPFIIVPITAEADDSQDLLVTSDMAIGFKGDPFTYDDFTPEQLEALKVKGDPFLYTDFTPEQIVELQRPATDAATVVNEAEALRVTAETTRVENEQVRVTAESLRATAETTRQGNETDRQTAEGLRVTAEQTRQTAEGLRQQAENKRQTDTSIAISNAENATEDANAAADLANEKADLANEKALLANNAATNANTKAVLADTAANNANNVANTYAAELALKELKANKKTILTDSDTDYPTTKAVNTGLGLKADKAQEEWITATLLNEWVEYSQGSVIQYHKDSFGYVHLRGQVKLGLVPSDIILLPVGYRPKGFIYIGIYGGRTIIISQGGGVRILAGTNGIASLDNIIFKAEF